MDNNANRSATIQAFIATAVIVIAGILIFRGCSKSDELRIDKSRMINSLQKYVTSGVLTVEDFDAEQVEKTKTYTIYRVKIKKQNTLANGEIYVGLVKPDGKLTEYVITGNDVSSIREKIR